MSPVLFLCGQAVCIQLIHVDSGMSLPALPEGLALLSTWAVSVSLVLCTRMSSLKSPREKQPECSSHILNSALLTFKAQGRICLPYWRYFSICGILSNWSTSPRVLITKYISNLATSCYMLWHLTDLHHGPLSFSLASLLHAFVSDTFFLQKPQRSFLKDALLYYF